jgi:NADPH:quinone reductase-like Zn-dependent oxidoreductase
MDTATIDPPTGTSPTDPNDSADPTDTMRSVVHHAYDLDPDRALRVGDIPRPAMGDDRVLVRVHAASVDRGTWHIMAGLPYPIRLAGFGVRRPKHANPGRAFAGTVAAVGRDVAGFAPGDEVYGTADASIAEFVVAKPHMVTAKPANLSFEEAAAVPISGLTALQAVRDRARVEPGQHVLVIGASGGVGTFAVQIAKAFGAEVTGVASRAKADLVAALGADHVVAHEGWDIAADGPRYDSILDIGGHRRLSHLRRALTPTGRLVIVGSETGGRWLGGLDRQLRAIALSPFIRQSLGTFVSSENADDLAALRELVEARRVSPVVDRTYSLADTAAAIRRLADGDVRGKVVIAVPGD